MLEKNLIIKRIQKNIERLFSLCKTENVYLVMIRESRKWINKGWYVRVYRCSNCNKEHEFRNHKVNRDKLENRFSKNK